MILVAKMIEVKATFGLQAKGGNAEDSLEPKQRSGVGIWASGCQRNDGTEGYPERLLVSHFDMKAQRPRMQASINGSFPRTQFTMPLRWRQF